MRKLIFILSLAWLSFAELAAAAFVKSDQGVKLSVDSLQIELQFYAPSLVRVIKYPLGKTFEKQSLSVVKTPETVRFKLNELTDVVELSSSELTVSITKSNGQIRFYHKNKDYVKEISSDFVNFNDAGQPAFTVKQSFVLERDELIYGLGQQQDGKLSRRGVDLKMVQGNTEDYIPFFQSTKNYGIFWDNYSPTRFKDSQDSTYFQSEVGDGIDYYFMAGTNADEVIAQMRDLTGQVPMFPLWTYGFWQSRERYKSQDELLEVVKKYRELKVPLDGIIQDWQYWGNNYLWNATEFLNTGFKNPKKMIEDVHSLNAHMIISIWNSFGPKTKIYRELDSIHALFNFQTWPQSGLEFWPPRMDYPSGVRVYDPYNPEARNIYWKYLKKNIFDLGIDGWWLDSSEPDHHNFKDSDFDEQCYLGSFRKVRNAFPLMSVGGISLNQQKDTQNKRVFMLTRSAFAGQQRYGANLWSGDVSASWQALRNQITAGLNVSMSAYPHWNSDLGGFFVGNFKDPLHNPDYRELYVRWIQFGVFCPMMRSHGESAPREIYQFGAKGNPVYDAVEKSIRLRYSLLPYIYSMSWLVTNHQYSFMRPLMMDFGSDEKALELNDEFMFGSSFLVCPVTEALYLDKTSDKVTVENFSKLKTKNVYLPEGTDWWNYYTNEKRKGGQNVEINAPLDEIPLFVKAGSLIPIGPDVQFANQKKWDEIEIRIYPGKDASFTLYEDENDNYNYKKGLYSEIKFQWNEKSKSLTIEKRKGEFPGMLLSRRFNLKMIGSETKTITYTGQKLIVKF